MSPQSPGWITGWGCNRGGGVTRMHSIPMLSDRIRRLQGIEYSKEEQLKKLDTLRKQLQLKKDLLLKYRHMCSFDIPK
ncbi:hypothetical protein PR048_009343 [Dryococelus australis]|uniref:Mediator of RNA polymerase II transcription subunit 9 n=1 Tax=Dryococelus australis TaxID=614101 RepID=A0ABQ9I0J6_9NEOP|nr:hypothetical protein PR048_009343 [Dryococelus australis]